MRVCNSELFDSMKDRFLKYQRRQVDYGFEMYMLQGRHRYLTHPHANSVGRILQISEKHHFMSKKHAKIVQNRETNEKSTIFAPA